MKTFILLDSKNRYKIPKKFRGDDNRYSDKLVEHFLNNYTVKGNKILDPFAGLGTTMLIAEEMDRVPYGVEYNKERFEFIRSRLKHKENLVKGDSRKIDTFNFPRFDFCMTSPPYMSKGGDNEYALTSYTTKGTYERYLKEIKEIYRKISKLMKPNSYVVIEVSNMKRKNVTTLAWDMAKVVSDVLHFEGEVIVGWRGRYGPKKYPLNYNHSYCLIFKNK